MLDDESAKSRSSYRSQEKAHVEGREDLPSLMEKEDVHQDLGSQDGGHRSKDASKQA